MAQTEDPQGSPRWWLRELHKRLLAQRVEVDRCEDYDAGKHPLAFATTKFRQTFGSLFSAFADNWCPIVIDAPTERLFVQGFRTVGSDTADKAAARLWNHNFLDADHGLAIREAIKCGTSYLMVSPPPRGSTIPQITVEHASQVIVATAPGNRRQRVAALKLWLDDSGHLMAYVYSPNHVYRFQSKKTVADAGAVEVDWIEQPGLPHREAHPFGVVPVIPLENDPGLLRGGRSDLHAVIPIQNAVNKLVADMIVASEFASFRQRWATGLELPTDEDGNPVDDERFLASVSRVWAVEDENAKFGEFQVTDLSNYTGAIGMLIQHLAALSRTPSHYFASGGSISNVSGDTLKAAETGLVAKSNRKQVGFGPSLGEVIRVALRRGPETRYEPIWRDVETRSSAELMDAALKMKKLGAPDSAVWDFIGATPQQIEQWTTENEAKAKATAALIAAGGIPLDRAPQGDDADDDTGSE